MVDTKVALLQALTSGEAYGLEIIQRISDCTGGKWVPLQGRVYPALRELEADGFLESYDGDPIPERGGRPRRYYRLTAKGRRAAASQQKALLPLFQHALEVIQ